MTKTAITPTREQNYPEWYQQVIAEADMAENSPVRGCMVIKPWGYAIWELMQAELDKQFKATGHVNAYFPLLIPLKLMEKEAEHVDGFAKECAVVTHHCLKADGKGGLVPDGELEEPYIIRPTSETIIGTTYAKWVQSYRDLPILINQWANVMRWEMRTRLFLRTSEFLWQEGHTAHATAEEALTETLLILDVYAKFVEDHLAVPVIKGEKTVNERFPGAVHTYTIEAMMQDRKALQAGTSHFFGQNFAKAYEIQFLNQAGHLENAWTTSWGASTRLIGGMIMTHSDDDGLVLPPAIAPEQIVILPIVRQDENTQAVYDYCEKLQLELQNKTFMGKPVRVKIDRRDLRGGDKFWQWVKKGVPLRLEIGARDISNNAVCLTRRDQAATARQSINCNEFVDQVESLLTTIQANLLTKAKKLREDNSRDVTTLDEFKAFFAGSEESANGFVSCYAVDDVVLDEFLKPMKITARCIPNDQASNQSGKCIFTGKTVNKKIIFAKAY